MKYLTVIMFFCVAFLIVYMIKNSPEYTEMIQYGVVVEIGTCAPFDGRCKVIVLVDNEEQIWTVFGPVVKRQYVSRKCKVYEKITQCRTGE